MSGPSSSTCLPSCSALVTLDTVEFRETGHPVQIDEMRSRRFPDVA